MVKHMGDGRPKRPDFQSIAWSQIRRHRAIFRSDPEVASPEDYGRKFPDLACVERAAACQSYLDRAATWQMLPN